VMLVSMAVARPVAVTVRLVVLVVVPPATAHRGPLGRRLRRGFGGKQPDGLSQRGEVLRAPHPPD
jgi:hypothetical protein